MLNNVNLPLDFPELAEADEPGRAVGHLCRRPLRPHRPGIASLRPAWLLLGASDSGTLRPLCGRGLRRLFQKRRDGAHWAAAGLHRRQMIVSMRYRSANSPASESRTAEQYLRALRPDIFATAAFRHYFEQTIPLDPARVQVIEMGIDPCPRRELSPETNLRPLGCAIGKRTHPDCGRNR